MRKITVAFLGLALVLAATAPAAAADVDTITVAATENIDITADTGHITFGVRSRDVSAAVATGELSRLTDAVLRALRDAGFTDDELATSEVTLERGCLRQCHDPNPKDGIPNHPVYGYKGSAAITVDTQQLDRLGEAIDAAVAAGAQSIRGISYRVEDKDAAVLEALRQAMRTARAKAEVIAEESGRTLGPTLVVTEGRTTAPSQYSLARGLTADSIGSGGAAASIPFPVEPPTLHASAHVEVTYAMQ
ncbi:MAG TPA: SIMPL domain-containing protein [Actinomycetota bacterium]|nr:SIMPL domain-containing protein [Actinomycetota bacterium]